MTIIDKPGFYISKAGKCEVVAISQGFAFGFILGSDHPSRRARIWYADNGHSTEWANSCITGPYIEPRKPVEAWAIVNKSANQRYLYWEKQDAEDAFGGEADRLIHLREVEDEKP